VVFAAAVEFRKIFQGPAEMRSFICSALIIASVLIGQQWVAKSSEAQGAMPLASAQIVAVNPGYAKWMANGR